MDPGLLGRPAAHPPTCRSPTPPICNHQLSPLDSLALWFPRLFWLNNKNWAFFEQLRLILEFNLIGQLLRFLVWCSEEETRIYLNLVSHTLQYSSAQDKPTFRLPLSPNSRRSPFLHGGNFRPHSFRPDPRKLVMHRLTNPQPILKVYILLLKLSTVFQIFVQDKPEISDYL